MCAIFCWVELCINFKLERGRFNDPYFKQNIFISFFQRQMIRCFICIFLFLLKIILFQGKTETFFLELIFFCSKTCNIIASTNKIYSRSLWGNIGSNYKSFEWVDDLHQFVCQKSKTFEPKNEIVKSVFIMQCIKSSSLRPGARFRHFVITI